METALSTLLQNVEFDSGAMWRQHSVLYYRTWSLTQEQCGDSTQYSTTERGVLTQGQCGDSTQYSTTERGV